MSMAFSSLPIVVLDLDKTLAEKHLPCKELHASKEIWLQSALKIKPNAGFIEWGTNLQGRCHFAICSNTDVPAEWILDWLGHHQLEPLKLTLETIVTGNGTEAPKNDRLKKIAQNSKMESYQLILIDDNHQHVANAQKEGFCALHYQNNAPELLKQINSFLINPKEFSQKQPTLKTLATPSTPLGPISFSFDIKRSALLSRRNSLNSPKTPSTPSTPNTSHPFQFFPPTPQTSAMPRTCSIEEKEEDFSNLCEPPSSKAPNSTNSSLLFHTTLVNFDTLPAGGSPYTANPTSNSHPAKILKKTENNDCSS